MLPAQMERHTSPAGPLLTPGMPAVDRARTQRWSLHAIGRYEPARDDAECTQIEPARLAPPPCLPAIR